MDESPFQKMALWDVPKYENTAVFNFPHSVATALHCAGIINLLHGNVRGVGGIYWIYNTDV